MMELVVVISIFVIISGMILADYPGFSERVALERTAQEIALSMREAETLALSVRESAPGSGTFAGYGVHFSSASPREYILFVDLPVGPGLPGNGVYDGVSEEIDHFFIEKSPQIVDICVNTETSPPGNCSVSFVDIVYLRPDPTITITSNLGGHPEFSVMVQTPRRNYSKEIIAWITGQIEIR